METSYLIVSTGMQDECRKILYESKRKGLAIFCFLYISIKKLQCINTSYATYKFTLQYYSDDTPEEQKTINFVMLYRKYFVMNKHKQSFLLYESTVHLFVSFFGSIMTSPPYGCFNFNAFRLATVGLSFQRTR